MATSNEPTGPGWFTVAQFQGRYNIAGVTARARLLAMHRAGALEQWTGTGTAHNGTRRVITKYRMKRAA